MEFLQVDDLMVVRIGEVQMVCEKRFDQLLYSKTGRCREHLFTGVGCIP